MKRILVTFLSILLFLKPIAGVNHPICPTQPIEAREGDDVTLQCLLDPPVNVVNYTVDWKRTDLRKVVHSYRHNRDHAGPQIAQYRDRTTLSHEDLSRGLLTLQISSVQSFDSGPYRCFVPAWTASCTIELIVVRRDRNQTNRDASSTRPPLEEVTGPNNPYGKSRTAGHAGTIVVFAFVLTLVLGLLMRGTLQNRSQMHQLNTQAADGGEDLERPAEIDLQDVA